MSCIKRGHERIGRQRNLLANSRPCDGINSQSSAQAVSLAHPNIAVNKPMKRVVVIFLLLMISACSRDDSTSTTDSAKLDAGGARETETQNLFDLERVARGAKLFQENCAQCHGPQAQGHPDWKRARKEGYAAAPPLNGTGTDISLTRERMVEVIRKGARRKGVMVMPAWKGRVGDDQIIDIISWYQALWPAEAYQHWRRANAPVSKKKNRSKG